MVHTTAPDGAHVYLTRSGRTALKKLDAPRAAALQAGFARVGQDLLRRATRAAVDPSWARRTWPQRHYPQQCYHRTAQYLLDHPQIVGARLVHGVASHAPGHIPFDHAWIELPGNIVFDGVVQAFFTRGSYYAVMSAVPIDVYPRARAERLLRVHAHAGPWNTKWVPTAAHVAAYAAAIRRSPG